MINPLSLASFANIFYHSETCLFVLFMGSFAMQEIFSLIGNAFCLIFSGCFRQKVEDWPGENKISSGLNCVP